MRTLETSVSQPKLVEHFCLVLETLGRLFVYGIFEELLSGSNVIRENTTSEGELSEVFTQDFEVEWNFLLARVGGIERIL